MKAKTMPTKRPRLGSKMETWFGGQPDGLSIVIAVRRYTGLLGFTYVVRLTAPRTNRGWMEIVI